jgi:hypothetical protein
VVRLGRKQAHLAAGQGAGSRVYGIAEALARKVAGVAAAPASGAGGGFFSRFFGGAEKSGPEGGAL